MANNKENEEKIEFEKEYIEEQDFFSQFMKAGGFTKQEAEDHIAKLRHFKYELNGEYDEDYVYNLMKRVNSNTQGDPNIKMTFDTNLGEFMNMEVSEKYFSIDGVNFGTMEEYVAIKKNDENYTFEEFQKDFPLGFVTPDKFETDNPFLPYPDEYEDFYNSIEPMSAKEAMNRYKDNAEQRMVVFTIMSPAKVIQELGGTLIDSQTITKKREYTRLKSGETVDHKKHRSMELYDIEEVEFPDTYELYQVDSSVMGLDPNNGDDEHVYILTMKDTSTERMYGLFIDSDSEAVRNRDAIEAIASTFEVPSTGGEVRPMTKEEYLNNMRSES